MCSSDLTIQNLNKDQVPIHKSYKCLAKRTLKNDNGEAQELKIASSQFEAFRNVTGDQRFSPCKMFNSLPLLI